MTTSIDASSPPRQSNVAPLTGNVIDNPCWGSPIRCSLAHLLQHYSRDKSVLYETSNYLVLNKPPDLRMDGAYPATVQKLLCYWYPPPSMSSRETDLLAKISQLHTPVKDNELRPCHQLDYATSGVLLVARSREAAAAATEAFASRSAEKKYVAIVNGHVEVNQNWPFLQKESLQILKDQEMMYRKGKAKKRKDTFVGFMPVHAMFHKWQAHYQKQSNGEENSHSKRPRREGAIDINQLWKQAMNDDDELTDNELNQLASSKWKDVKNNQRWNQLLERLANLYNDALRPSTEGSTNSIPNLPTLFRIQGEPEHSFYIFAPLAQVDDDFLMRLQPNTNYNTPFDGKPNLDYKAALTRCTVLQHGTVGDAKNLITKVRLEPKTGRRHQLRLHMVVVGHAIVGDVSYNTNSVNCPRMCLHAHSLSLPLLNDVQLQVTAPDPFIMGDDDELLLQDGTTTQGTDASTNGVCTARSERK